AREHRPAVDLCDQERPLRIVLLVLAHDPQDSSSTGDGQLADLLVHGPVRRVRTEQGLGAGGAAGPEQVHSSGGVAGVGAARGAERRRRALPHLHLDTDQAGDLLCGQPGAGVEVLGRCDDVGRGLRGTVGLVGLGGVISAVGVRCAIGVVRLFGPDAPALSSSSAASPSPSSWPPATIGSLPSAHSTFSRSGLAGSSALPPQAATSISSATPPATAVVRSPVIDVVFMVSVVSLRAPGTDRPGIGNPDTCATSTYGSRRAVPVTMGWSAHRDHRRGRACAKTRAWSWWPQAFEIASSASSAADGMSLSSSVPSGPKTVLHSTTSPTMALTVRWVSPNASA